MKLMKGEKEWWRGFAPWKMLCGSPQVIGLCSSNAAPKALKLKTTVHCPLYYPYIHSTANRPTRDRSEPLASKIQGYRVAGANPLIPFNCMDSISAPSFAFPPPCDLKKCTQAMY